LAAFETSRRSRKRLGARERRRRQGRQPPFHRFAHPEENAGRRGSAGRSSEERAVKRGPPRSHRHRAAPSCSVYGPPPSGEGTARGRDGARVGTRRKPRHEGLRKRASPKGDGCPMAAPGDDRSTSVRVSGSECRKSIGRIALRAARTRILPRARTRNSSRDGVPRTVTRTSTLERERNDAGASSAPPSRGAIGHTVLRASLVGIAPGGVRARRLGKSQGREREVV
jgi:hypothetical protein